METVTKQKQKITQLKDTCTSLGPLSYDSVYHNKSSKTFKKGKSSETFEHWFAGGSITARLDYETVAMGTKGTIVKAAVKGRPPFMF